MNTDPASTPANESGLPAVRARAQGPEDIAREEADAARLDAASTANQATGKDTRGLPPGAEDPPAVRSHEREPAP